MKTQSNYKMNLLKQTDLFYKLSEYESKIKSHIENEFQIEIYQTEFQTFQSQIENRLSELASKQEKLHMH